MLLEMVKLAVVGHRAHLEATIALLQRLAVLHVVDVAAEPALGASPFVMGEVRAHELERLRSLRTRLDALASLQVGAPARTAPVPLTADDLAAQVDALLPEAERTAAEIAELESELRTLPRHLSSLRRLSPLADELGLNEANGDSPTGFETMALLIDRQHGDVLETLRKELELLADHRCEMVSAVVDRETIGALLLFPRELSATIHARLGGERVSRVRLPDAFAGLSFRESLSRMEARLEAIPGEIARLRRRLLERSAIDFASARAVVTARLDQLELMRHLGGSEHTFVIAGWLPRRSRAAFEKALAEEAGLEVATLELPKVPDEEPPVALVNTRGSRPFERLVRLFGLPTAHSIDPSGLMSVFMPLFFGMMVGDLGHGVVLLAVALWVRRRWRESPMVRDLMRILALGAGWAVVWGLVFGELFGELGAHHLGLSPLWISRGDSHAVGALLVFSLGVGAAHITLGLLLGIWSAARAHQRGELVERAGQLISLVGLFSIVGVLAQRLPAGLMTPSFAAILVGMVLVGVTKGWLGLLLGPLDVISGAGNVLSYLRIAALGLASVYLSQVANELARVAPAVIGALVAVLLHALNVALASFSPTIQALRLHYVEFFGKFYDVGGTPYQPFGAAAADTDS